MEPEYLQRMVETEARSKSNTKRLDEMEQSVIAVNELAKSVGVMANEMSHQTEALKNVQEDVKQLKAVPARRWEQVVEKIIFGVVCTALGFLATAIVTKLI